MRKEIFRMPRPEAEALLGRAAVVRIATTRVDGAPVLRTVHGVVVRGAVAWHGAPAGEKLEAVGRAAVVAAEEVVAAVPSYFLDPERACPATTLYRSVEVHGVIEEVTCADHKAEVLQALMEKLQPEGGHVPIDAGHPLYARAVAGILVLQVGLGQLDGKAKLAQNRTPAERARLLEKLWERGLPGDPAAVELLRAANPGTPEPSFLAAPAGAALVCAPAPGDAEDAADLVVDAYWNGDMTRAAIVCAHLGSAAWVGARDATGRLVATARAASDQGKRAWIYDVMVAPAWRGRGLGEAVMRLLLEHPAVRRVRRVYLATRDAQRFYSRLGFGDRHELETCRKTYASTEMVLLREASVNGDLTGRGEPQIPCVKGALRLLPEPCP
jgi:ribosomal protein S18 acetylase RimI-like enzyme/nitroimidazol reductase NimA-like FMN-containing flavoprotein (pyridoxamine 5'-phosphate oxidase superfamily)